MTRTAIPALALLGLLLLSAPLALAQKDDDASGEAARPDDAAWVDDCPPDMMCAMRGADDKAGDEAADGSADGDKPTYDGDCGGEVCAYQGEPGTLGPDGCIDCMQPPAGSGQDAQAAESNEVPGPSLAALGGILAVAAIALGIARRR